MRRRPLARQLVLAFGSVAGVALAHVLDYVMVVPDGTRRAELLAETGHAWHHVAALGAVAGLLAVSGAFWCGLRRATGPPGRSEHSVPLLEDVRSVAVLQMALFAGIEAVERVLSHESLAGLVQSRVFLVGLALQALVACVVVTVLRTAEEAAACLSVASELPACSPGEPFNERRSVAVPLGTPDRPDCRGPPRSSLRLTS